MRQIPRFRLVALALLLAAPLAVACGGGGGGEEAETGSTDFTVPVSYHQLDNGLRVVFSRDHTAPIVTVAVYYDIGFRIEPRDRTGFAHLFEHMMFQGSKNLGKMEFAKLVQQNGGVLNGSTRFDFTNYFEIVPAHMLETMLWAEADRMRGLAITQDNLTNQQGVVKNEVKVNVLNRPYGGFPWLDLPQTAFDNWYNAHNFYGDLEDLDAASLDDVQAFFDAYYAPNNAVVVVVGDFDEERALAWVEEYFGDIPPADLAEKPDISEPPQTVERRDSRVDPKANRPALAFAYRMPERNSDEYYAMILLDQILLQGDDSRLYQALVQEEGLTGELSGGINWPLGNALDYNGPMLWSASLFHDAGVSEERILEVVDRVIAGVRDEPIAEEELERALIKLRSAFYDTVTGTFGFGRADLLAAFALFDDDPSRINRLEERFRAVGAEELQRTAREVLVPTNRTVFTIEPGAAPAAGQEEA